MVYQKIIPAFKYVSRTRTIFSKKQTTMLEEVFRATKYPAVHKQRELAQLMLLPESKIKVCFFIEPQILTTLWLWHAKVMSPSVQEGHNNTKPDCKNLITRFSFNNLW